jgi:release factor H-coupled RctB family protein
MTEFVKRFCGTGSYHNMNTITEKNVRLIASPGAWIEGEAVRQLYATANLDGMRAGIGFPDLHPGKGAPTGAAFISEAFIYPHIIGSDIGCGMAFWKTALPRRKAKLDRLAGLRFDLEHPWEGDWHDWLSSHALPSTPFDDSMGTIGGGNHFAELQAVERVHDSDIFKALDLDRETLMALVHSGSRGYGESILWRHTAEHGASGIDPSSGAGQTYLGEHDAAVRWARANRQLIGQRFLECLRTEGPQIWDGCHNGISSQQTLEGNVWLHRKGAVDSESTVVVIPGSRGTFSYLVQPIGDGESHAWSLAHGAGRKWSRSESRQRSRERHRVSELVQTPLGGRVVCEQRDLLYEEAPMAYKPIESVIEALEEAGLVKVIATLRPLLTYKTRVMKR